MLTFVALIVLSNLCTFLLAYNNGYSKGESVYGNHAENNTGKMAQDNPLSDIWTKIDYPLIEYYFDDESDWLIIFTDLENLSQDDGLFKVIQNPQNLRFCTQDVYVTTFPIGLGTTPHGEILIYKNRELEKRVQFFDYCITSQVVWDEIEELNKTRLLELINSDIQFTI